jgi:predicted enzyme related to lactoylglutathione lyase
MDHAQGFLVNIDVPDLEAGARFYTQALALRVGRRFAEPWLELIGGNAPIYLLEKKPGSTPAPGVLARTYERHWSPVHFDFLVPEIDTAVQRALAAGAKLESPAEDAPYGKLAMLSDPFGHGFCLIEMNAQGYDAIPLAD